MYVHAYMTCTRAYDNADTIEDTIHTGYVVKHTHTSQNNYGISLEAKVYGMRNRGHSKF